MKNKYPNQRLLVMATLLLIPSFLLARTHKAKSALKDTTLSVTHLPKEIIIKSDNTVSVVQDDVPAKSTEINTTSHCIPILGKVISPFGNARGSHRHTGTDVKLCHGDTIRAACCGVVTKACPYAGYGKLIIIQHPEKIETYYSHLSKILINKGDTVRAGEPIGLGGRTGRATTDHLHFEIRKNKVPVNAEKYFNFASGSLRMPLFKDELVFDNQTTAKSDIALNPANPKELIIKSDPVAENKPVQTSEATQAVVCQNDLNSEADLPDEIVVKAGDTLYSLSRKYKTTVQHLQELNGMTSNNLKIGMKLKMR